MAGDWKKLKKYTPLSLRGWLVYLAAMALASLLCILLRQLSTSDVHVPLIFVLAVLIVSLLTDGYFYGILAALTSVFAVNYAFTYPYWHMNFTIYGYPLTFLTMLGVGCAVSTLTTRVKEREQLRVESEREKVRANLMRAVSHDLRTPLTAISGSISAVLESEDTLTPAQRRELLIGAREDAEWLCRMVENLLSVTRIGDGAADGLHKQEEALEEVLGAAVLAFKKRNPALEVTVTAPDTLLLVPMDAVLIAQVLQNLMDNAVTHGRGTSQVAVSARTEAGSAVITVEDDGGGIEPRLLEHLFDGTLAFTGGSGADTTRGMGIGLTVCRTIVEAHGGRLSARN
ncbi:MAG: DUF4118 domain-containing protein, partial [Oscillospiraceae bacterium]|nr:DUF4118 domain-containing protein [Oscillospiraceae bacterium]